MPEISVKVTDRTPELMARMELAIGKYVRKAAGYIEGQLKTSMAEPKHGRSYSRGKSATHVASAPGESPAVDSSNLTGSIQTIYPSTLEAKVGTNVPYAVYLEEGTHARAVGKVMVMGPHMGGMQPRPLWEATAKESLPTLEAMLHAEMRGV